MKLKFMMAAMMISAFCGAYQSTASSGEKNVLDSKTPQSDAAKEAEALEKFQNPKWTCKSPKWLSELLGSALNSPNDNNAPVTHGQLKFIIYYWDSILHGKDKLDEDLSMCKAATPPPVTGNWVETEFVHDRPLLKVIQELFPFDRMCRSPCGGSGYNDVALKREIANLIEEINHLKGVINELRSRNVMRSAPEDITYLKEKVAPKHIFIPK